MQAEETEVD